jgi:GNAT superfamily N-acetyltransferase
MVWIEPHPRVAEPPFTIEPLAPNHDRAAFLCLEPKLTEFITGQAAWREQTNGTSTVYVCIDAKGVVWGYFTLNSFSIARADLLTATYGPEWEQMPKRKLGDVYRAFPRDQIGATMLGRVAVHKMMQGSGFGAALMTKMLEKVWEGSQVVASRVLILDAKNDKLVDVYTQYGFQLLSTEDRRMFMLMETVKKFVAA